MLELVHYTRHPSVSFGTQGKQIGVYEGKHSNGRTTLRFHVILERTPTDKMARLQLLVLRSPDISLYRHFYEILGFVFNVEQHDLNPNTFVQRRVNSF